MVVTVEANISKCDDLCSFAFCCCHFLGLLSGLYRKEKSAHTSSAIAVAKYVWARLSTFKRTIIGNAFCCFTSGYSFAYPLKVCYKRNGNDQSGSLLGYSLKAALKD